jgi:membrane-associated phospholipid phosphatase
MSRTAGAHRGVSTAPARFASRRPIWAGVCALAAALALLTGMVAAGWAPLVGADVRTILAAHTAVYGRTGAVMALVAVTDLGSPVTVTVLTAVVSVVLLLRGHSRDAAYLVIVRVVALGGETALKHILARPRPDLVPWLTTAEGFSFPSGHTTGTTALCVSLLVVVVPCLQRRGRAVAVVVAVVVSVAVAMSRVLLGVHYPSDVVGGLLAGALAAVLIAVVLPANLGELHRRPMRATGSAGTAATFPHDLQHERDQRDDDDERDHREQVGVDARDGRAEAVPGEHEPDGPEEATDDLPDGEGSHGGVQGTGHRVEHGAYDRDEPGQHDGLGRAVLFEELLGPPHAVGDLRPPRSLLQGPTRPPSDEEPDLRPEQGAGRSGQQYPRQAQV